MFISVDLPDPLGPITATISPRPDRERDAAQRRDALVAERVELGQRAPFDHHGPRWNITTSPLPAIGPPGTGPENVIAFGPGAPAAPVGSGTTTWSPSARPST